MNKDLLAISIFLLLMFSISYAGHLLFKEGYASNVALDMKMNSQHAPQSTH